MDDGEAGERKMGKERTDGQENRNYLTFQSVGHTDMSRAPNRPQRVSGRKTQVFSSTEGRQPGPGVPSRRTHPAPRRGLGPGPARRL